MTRRLGYFAGVAKLHSWVRLKIATDTGQDEIVIAFHGDGERWRGIVAGTAFLVRRSEDETGTRDRHEPEQLCDVPFSIAWTETTAAVDDRFALWLDEVIARGLAAWRQGIQP